MSDVLSVLTAMPVEARRGATLSAALGLGYTLLRLRLLPVAVMRAWFLVSALLTVFPASALLYLVDPLRYLGVPRRITQRLCTLVMVLAFKATCLLNPQISTTVSFEGTNGDGTPCRSWDDLNTSGIAMTLNHTSFWDVFALIGAMPVAHLLNTRTLMKSTLRNIPVFGGCFDRVGHFPVYFKSDEDGNFQVDKERQAAVQLRVDAHLEHGGNIAIFPEGAVNKHPEKLQTFRFGTFATIFQHRMPLYYCVTVGNEKTWPASAPYGGYPADVHMRIGAYSVDFDTKDSKQVAGELQMHMQHVFDDIKAGMDAKRGKQQKIATAAASDGAAPLKAAMA